MNSSPILEVLLEGIGKSVFVCFIPQHPTQVGFNGFLFDRTYDVGHFVRRQDCIFQGTLDPVLHRFGRLACGYDGLSYSFHNLIVGLKTQTPEQVIVQGLFQFPSNACC